MISHRPGAGSSPLALRISFSSLPPAALDEVLARLSRAQRHHARAG
jgi:hypothetical protein